MLSESAFDKNFFPGDSVMPKKALVVGVDKYDKFGSLSGCVSDAKSLGALLETHSDDTPNFEVNYLSSDQGRVDRANLAREINQLFSGDPDVVLLYFAGHGHKGYLVAQDGCEGALGFPLIEVLGLANNAYPRIKSIVIVLDCCNAGVAGDMPEAIAGEIAALGKGVTILASCRSNEEALEFNGHGYFTYLLLGCLQGAAADICGRITPASVYANIDQTLGENDQRPVYKANVHRFTVLRRIAPRVALSVLRELTKYFPEPEALYQLGPECEPPEDRGEYRERYEGIRLDDARRAIYQKLQACNREGLVRPSKEPHMWHAAMKKDTCYLTELGKHYHTLAKLKRIGRDP